jgi:hypothetical protein
MLQPCGPHSFSAGAAGAAPLNVTGAIVGTAGAADIWRVQAGTSGPNAPTCHREAKKLPFRSSPFRASNRLFPAPDTACMRTWARYHELTEPITATATGSQYTEKEFSCCTF